MVIFKEYSKNLINKNKNGTKSYSFSSENYNAGKCGYGHYLGGNISQGDSNYDAARANMGEPWKMPTQDQCSELISNTEHIWTIMDGVRGYIFYSKIYHSKYIFFSVPGYWDGTNLNNKTVGGYYWSTTYNGSYIVHIYLFYNSTYLSHTIQTDATHDRYRGQSIRPVAPPRPW